MVEKVYCVHCGALAKHPVYKTINGQSLAFCCGGCVEVYEMMREEGFDSGQPIVEPANMSVPLVYPVSTGPDKSAGSQIISYHISGMTCANCVATVTRQLRKVSGVIDVQVFLETERAAVKMIPNQVSFVELHAAVVRAGYDITPESEE